MTGTATEVKSSPPSGERFEPTFMHGRIIEAEHLARYAWAAQFAAGRRVLDAACGAGYGSRTLAAAGAAAVVGVDLDAEVIDAARNGGSEPSFEVGDIRSLGFDDDEFDLIVSFETIEHVTEPERVLDEFRRVLRPDGLLVISTPNREVYAPGNPFHLRELAPNELGAELEQRFSEVTLFRQHTWVASAILDDGSFSAGDNRTIDGVSVRKATTNEPGLETYTLGLAGDVDLPKVAPVLELSADIDLREWGERLSIADHAIEDHPADAGLRHRAEIERLQAELHGLRQQLLRTEEELAGFTDLDSRLAHAEGALDDYVLSAVLMNSKSWRLTSPLRRLGSAIRKYRQ